MHFAAADYDTLVFDCDGVILDSNRIKSAAFRTVTAPFGAEASARLAAITAPIQISVISSWRRKRISRFSVGLCELLPEDLLFV